MQRAGNYEEWHIGPVSPYSHQFHPRNISRYPAATVGYMTDQGGTQEPAIMQLSNERRRMTAAGKRTDDGTACTLLAIAEIGGTWALYPHGADQLGVRLPADEVARIARTILGQT